MKKNLGITDRIVRFVIFDVLLGATYLGIELPVGWAYASFIVSVLLLISIITGYSPIYHLIGWNTRNAELKSEKSD